MHFLHSLLKKFEGTHCPLFYYDNVTLSEKIKHFVEQTLQGSDKFLVDFIAKPGNRIMVFIDGDHGVTIDDCRNISRAIEQNFDRDTEDYDLTVSSAGADHPLVSERQFRKNLGREIDVITTDGMKTEGFLESVNENGIVLEHPLKNKKEKEKSPNTEISFLNIKTAKIKIKIGK